MPERRLALTEARQIAISAQGLERRRRAGTADVLRRLRSVQLDTIAVLARSHELVPYARIGAVGRDTVERTYWGSGRAFEYWSHAACILPVESYPYFAFRRRAHRRKADAWGVDRRAVRNVRAALRDRGPQTATELGGARRSSGWWEWSDTKRAVEWMLSAGDVVVMDRRAWKRVYSLASTSIDHPTDPDWSTALGVYGPDTDACVRTLLLDAVRALGVGTLDDLKDMHRLRSTSDEVLQLTAATIRNAIGALVERGDITPVRVDGWSQPAFADPARLRRRTAGSVTTLLSPFDSLVWYRPRLERLFDVRLRIEAYTPSADRKHGYFAMPVLHGGRIIGLVDPGRDADTLVAKRITVFDKDVDGFATAIADAATWVGMQRVRVDAASAGTTFARSVQSRANALLS